MCKNACPVCNTKVKMGKIFLDALFNVEAKQIRCESCEILIKPDYSSSIILAVIANAIIIPLFFHFGLSLFQMIMVAILYIPIVGFLFICSTKINKE